MAIGNSIGDAYIDVHARTDDFEKEASGKVGGALKGVLAAASGALVAAGGVQLFKGMIDGASDLGESMSKNQTIFGDSAKSIMEFADNAAKGMGQSKNQALAATGVYGNLLRALGLNEEAAAGMSMEMVKLASDLASFNNTSVDEALEAIRSGLVGEAEPLKKFGVSMNEAALQAKALEMGLISNVKEGLNPQQKAMAASALIMSQTSLAHGDFERTSAGLANQSKILKAELTDLSSEIGTKLLPVAVEIATWLNSNLIPALRQFGGFIQSDVAPRVQELAILIGEKLGPVFATIGDVINNTAAVFDEFGFSIESVGVAIQNAVVIILGQFGVSEAKAIEWGDKIQAAFTQIAEAVQVALEVARAVIEGFVETATRVWRTFGDELLLLLQSVWTQISAIFQGAFDIISGLLDVFVGVFTGDWSRAWDGIKSILEGVWTIITGIVQSALQIMEALISASMTIIAGIFDAAWAGIRALIQAAADGIVALLEAAWNAVRAGVQAAWDAIVNLITTSAQRFMDIIAALPGQIIALGGAFVAAGVSLVESMWNGLQNIAGRMADFVGEVINGVTSIPGRAAGFAINAGVSIVDSIGSGLSNIADKMAGLAGNIISALYDMPGRAAGAAADIGRAIMNAIVDGVGDVGGAIWNKISGGISGLAGKVGGAIGNVFPFATGGNIIPFATGGQVIPHYAAGGTHRNSGLAFVGEYGPELVKFGGSAAIYPTNELEASLARALGSLGMGGGIVINVMIESVSAGNQHDVGRAVALKAAQSLAAMGINVGTRMAAGR